jgi:hypothetical protein
MAEATLDRMLGIAHRGQGNFTDCGLTLSNWVVSPTVAGLEGSTRLTSEDFNGTCTVCFPLGAPNMVADEPPTEPDFATLY